MMCALTKSWYYLPKNMLKIICIEPKSCPRARPLPMKWRSENPCHISFVFPGQVGATSDCECNVKKNPREGGPFFLIAGSPGWPGLPKNTSKEIWSCIYKHKHAIQWPCNKCKLS